MLFVASALLTSCSSDDEAPEVPVPTTSAITFGNVLNTQSATRAGTSVPLYNYVPDFNVYGINGNLAGNVFTKKDVVYNNYVVWHSQNSAATTTTNTDGWDYVGDYTTEGDRRTTSQRIKYWDYSQNCHYFWALANADRGQFSDGDLATDGRVATFTLDLSGENLSEKMALYYSEIKRVDMLDYGKVVTFIFKPYLSRVRFAFYETTPGFVVNNLRREDKVGDVENEKLQIQSDFVGDGAIVENGKCTLTYNYETQKITSEMNPKNTNATMTIGQVQYQTLTSRELDPNDHQTEEDNIDNFAGKNGKYLGRSSSNPSYALGGGPENNHFINVLPFEDRAKPITLHCVYDLINTTTGEKKTTSSTSVSIPKEYTKWLPGYEYTYVFKISGGEIQFVEVVQIGIKGWTVDQTEDHPLYNW